MASEQQPRCQATNVTGEPCGAAHWRDGFCRWHHPGIAEQRREWAIRGGRNSSTKARLKKQVHDGAMTTPELHALLCAVLKSTLSGRVDKGVANAVANLARAIKDVGGVADLEARIAELEALAGRRSG